MDDLRNDTREGTNGIDSITYNVLLNGTIFALAGNDSVTLNSTQGGRIDLGDGNDQITINQFTNLLSQNKTTIDGGAGTDTLLLKQYKAENLRWYWGDLAGWQLLNKDGSLTYAAVKNVENIEYAGGIKAKFTTEKMIKYGVEFEIGRLSTTGTVAADVITAYVNDTTEVFVRAGKGNDTINFYSYFSAVSYRLSLLDGGIGKDTLALSGSTELYKFEIVSGILYLQTYVNSDWAYTAKLTGIESVVFNNGVTGTIGSKGVSLSASDTGTSLFGTSGADNLKGGKGNDTITPLAGNDVIDLRAGGRDLVSISNDLYLAPITEVTIYGRQRDDTIELGQRYTVLSDSRSYTSTAPTGIQVGDIVLGWYNGAKTIFHYKE